MAFYRHQDIDFQIFSEQITSLTPDTKMDIFFSLHAFNYFLYYYIQYNQLPSPYQDQTNYFITSIVPVVLDCVTSIREIDSKAFPKIENELRTFFNLVVDFGLKSLEFGIDQFSELLYLIIVKYQNLEFFKNPNNIFYYNDLVSYFIHGSKKLDFLIEYSYSNQNEVTLNKLVSILSVCLDHADSSSISYFLEKKMDGCLIRIEKSIISMSKDQIRKANHQCLTEMFQYIIKYFLRDPIKYRNIVYRCSDFFMDTFQSDILDHQLFAIRSFSAFFVENSTIIDKVIDYCQSHGLINIFLSKQYHKEVVKSITPIAKYLSRSCFITRRNIQQTWDYCVKVDRTDRYEYVKLLITILEEQDKDIIQIYVTKPNEIQDIKTKAQIFSIYVQSFIQKFPEFSSISFQNLSNLLNIINIKDDEKEAVQEEILSICQMSNPLILEILQSFYSSEMRANKYTPFIIKAIKTCLDNSIIFDKDIVNSYVASVLHSQVEITNPLLISLYNEFPDNSQSKFFDFIGQEIIKSTISAESSGVSSSTTQIQIKSKNKEISDVFNLYFQFLNVNGLKLGSHTIIILFDTCKNNPLVLNQYWIFLLKCLQKDGKTFLAFEQNEENISSLLHSYLDQIKAINPRPPISSLVTIEMLDFLFSFFDYKCLLHNFLATPESISIPGSFLPRSYIYNSSNLPLLFDLFFPMVMFNDLPTDIQKRISQFIFTALINNYKTNRQEITQQIIELTAESMTAPELLFLYEYIIFLEKNVFAKDIGIERHESESRKLYQKVTFINGGQQKELHVLKSITYQGLKNICSFVFEMSFNEPILKINNQSFQENDQVFSSNEFQRIDNIEIIVEHNNSNLIDRSNKITLRSLPSIILNENLFQLQLYEYITNSNDVSGLDSMQKAQHEKLKNICIELLNLLPEEPISTQIQHDTSRFFQKILSTYSPNEFEFLTSYISTIDLEITTEQLHSFITKLFDQNFFNQIKNSYWSLSFLKNIVTVRSKEECDIIIDNLTKNLKSRSEQSFVLNSYKLLNKILDVFPNNTKFESRIENFLMSYPKIQNSNEMEQFLSIAGKMRNPYAILRFIFFAVENINRNLSNDKIFQLLSQLIEKKKSLTPEDESQSFLEFNFELLIKIHQKMNENQQLTELTAIENISYYTTIFKSMSPFIILGDNDYNEAFGDVLNKIFELFMNLLSQTTDSSLHETILTTLLTYYNNELTNSMVIHYFTNTFNVELDGYDLSQTQNIEMCGLINLGNNCYMNSVLQQIFYTFPVLIEVLNSKSTMDDAVQLKELFKNMFIRMSSPVQTKPFVDAFSQITNGRFTSERQEDAVEFFHELIEHISTKGRNIFKGETKDFIDDMSGNHLSERTEEFTTLDIVVRGKKNIQESLKEIEDFCMLTGSNKYRDSRTNQLVDAKKYSVISSLPPVLVLHLNRFTYDMETFERIKLDTRFEFSDKLEIKPGEKYNLKGIVMHQGTAEFGHYFSHIKVKGEWHTLNDTNVSRTTFDELRKTVFGGKTGEPSAYLLFYEKEELTPAQKSVYPALSFDFDADLPIPNSPEIKEQISQFRSETNFKNFILSKSFYDTMIQLSDPYTLMAYYFKIFSKSTLYDQNDELIDRIIEILSQNSQFRDDGVEIMTQNDESIHMALDILIHCNSETVVGVYKRFLISLMSLLERQKGHHLLEAFFTHIYEFIDYPIEKADSLFILLNDFYEDEDAILKQTSISGNILNFLQEFISPNRPQTNRESNFLQLLNSLFFTCNEESSIKFFELVIDNPFLVTTNQNRKEVIELLIIHGKANCPPIDNLYTFLSSLRNDEVLSIFNELMENL